MGERQVRPGAGGALIDFNLPVSLSISFVFFFPSLRRAGSFSIKIAGKGQTPTCSQLADGRRSEVT